MKKFFTVIISIVLFLSVASLTILLSVRSYFSKDSISELFGAGLDEFNMSEYIDEAFNSNAGTVELRRYLDEDEFSKAFSEYVSDFLTYAAVDNGKQPSSEKLKSVIEDAIHKYEKANDVFLDQELIDEIFDTFDAEMTRAKAEIFAENESQMFLSIVFGNYYIIPLLIAIVCLSTIFLINRNVQTICTSLGVINILNALTAWFITIVLKTIAESEQSLIALSKFFSSPFQKAGIISAVLGIGLLVLKISIKKQKREVQV